MQAPAEEEARMNKKIFLTMAILIVPVLLIAGCSATNASGNQADLGQEFNLRVGQSISISGENLSIEFDAVTSDSRSPLGAQTIWAGEAQIRLRVTRENVTSIVTLTEKGLTSEFTQDSFIQYKFSFKLLPYPEVGKQPATNDYSLVMKITK